MNFKSLLTNAVLLALGDGQVPTCRRCTLLSRECVRGLPFSFRYSNNLPSVELDPGDRALESSADFEFADDQVWVTPPTSNGSHDSTIQTLGAKYL